MVLIEKLRGHRDEGGVVLRYFVRPGSRRRPWIWLDVEDVPAFDSDQAWFEVEKVEHRWRAVRQVESRTS